MKITPSNGQPIYVPAVDTLADGSKVVDYDGATAVVHAWFEAADDDYRGWTFADVENCDPEPIILAHIAPGEHKEIQFKTWDLLYKPSEGYEGERNYFGLTEFPFLLDVEDDGEEEVTTPPCQICKLRGKVRIPTEGAHALREGQPVQLALPDTPRETREQITSGIHPECWTDVFG